MKHVLFIFHGMGAHAQDIVGVEDDGWADGVKKLLREKAEQFSVFGDGGFDELVELVPVTYDQVFHTILKSWDKSATALGKYLAGAPIEPLLTWMEGISDDEASFFWTHIVDVLLYRFFAQARDHVQTRVASKMVVKIVSELEAVDWDMNEVRFSVLAHSLGTAVAHDALHKLATTPIPDGTAPGKPNTALMPPDFRFHSYFAVANVSRVLWPKHERVEIETRVRPTSGGLSADRYYLHQAFRNFRHVADPVPAFWRFGPTDWGSRYMNVDVRHYRDINIHDLAHYLEHPGVYVRIFAGLLGNDVISGQEIEAAANAWSEYEGPLATAQRDLVTLTEQALNKIAGAHSGDAPDLASGLVDVAKELTRWASEAKLKDL